LKAKEQQHLIAKIKMLSQISWQEIFNLPKNIGLEKLDISILSQKPSMRKEIYVSKLKMIYSI